jgi:hypothetical protein
MLDKQNLHLGQKTMNLFTHLCMEQSFYRSTVKITNMTMNRSFEVMSEVSCIGTLH